MTRQSTPSNPAASARAVVTPGDVTWRQAMEGWGLVTALAAFAVAAALVAKAARALGATRS